MNPLDLGRRYLYEQQGIRHFLSPAAVERFAGRYDSIESYVAGLKSEFLFFVFELWKATGRDDPHKTAQLGWVEEDICDYMQHGPRLAGVLAWRFAGKTTLITCPFGLWRAFGNPDHKTLVVSKTGRAKAQEFTDLARKWIENVHFLKHMSPRDHAALRDSNTYGFDIAGLKTDDKVPSFKAAGIDGHITGSRAHTVLPDDIEDSENASSLAQRTTMLTRVNEFDTIAQYRMAHQPVTSPGGEVRVVGTFSDEESVYHAMAQNGYQFRTYPMICPEPGDSFLNLAPAIQTRIADGRLKPGDIIADYRVSREAVVAQQKKGRRWFSLQMQCQANVRETNRYPLRLDNFLVLNTSTDQGPPDLAWGLTDHDNAPTALTDIRMNGWPGDALRRPIFYSPPSQWLPFHHTFAAIDPGGSGKSETILTVGSALNGFLFIKALIAYPGGASPQNLANIASVLKAHKATRCLVEGNLYGSKDSTANPFINLLQVEVNRLVTNDSKWGCDVAQSWHTRNKEHRIVETIGPPLDAHRLVLAREVAADTDLQFQISRLTTEPGSLTRSDRVDALAQLVAALAATTRIDPKLEVAQRAKTPIQRELEAFLTRTGRKLQSFARL